MASEFSNHSSVIAAFALGVCVTSLLWWWLARVARLTARDDRPTASPKIPLWLGLGAFVASIGFAAIPLAFPAAPLAVASSSHAPTITTPTPEVAALASTLGLHGTSADQRAAVPAGDLAAMADRLATRLRDRTPDDHQGWLLLARSYLTLGRDADAVSAFERARPLLDSDAKAQAEYDETRKRIGR